MVSEKPWGARVVVVVLVMLAGVVLVVPSRAGTQPQAEAQTLSPGEVRISSRPYVAQSQILRTEARLVRIDAVVRDGKGRIVSGLKPENFTIFDDGKKEAIATFEVQTHTPLAVLQARAAGRPSAPAGQGRAATPPANGVPELRPRYVALYFDDLHTKSGDMRHVQLAAENFVHTGLSAGDQIALFTATSSVTVDFTSDASRVLDALANLNSRARVFDSGTCPRITPHDAYMITNFPNSDAYQVALKEAIQCNCDDQANIEPTCYSQQVQLVLIQAKQIWEPIKELSENTLETIRGVVDYLAKKPGERVLVLASSGFLTGTLETEVDGVMDDALRSGIVINALDAKGLYMEDPSHGRIQMEVPANSVAGREEAAHEAENFASDLMSMTAAMADFTVGTGGRFFHDRNDLDAGFYSLAVAPETEYLLGFAPENERFNGAYHKLKVEVNLPGKFDVQARPGYFAPTKETEEASQPTAEEKIDAEVRGSEEKSDFPLNIAEQSRIASNGARELSVQTRVDIHAMPFARQQDRHVDILTFVAALFDAQGKMVTGKEAQMELALKPETFERFSKSGIDGGMSLEAPPGMYRLRVVVEEALHGEMSATSRSVQIQ